MKESNGRHLSIELAKKLYHYLCRKHDGIFCYKTDCREGAIKEKYFYILHIKAWSSVLESSLYLLESQLDILNTHQRTKISNGPIFQTWDM